MTTRPNALVAALLLVPAVAVGTPASAVAEPPPYGGRTTLTEVGVLQNPSEDLVTAVTFSIDSVSATGGDRITISVSSCGQLLRQTEVVTTGPTDYVTVGLSPTGDTFDPFPNSVNTRVGPSVQFDVDITQPGFDTFRISGSYGDRSPGSWGWWSVKRPSCAAIAAGTGGGAEGGQQECRVTRWSRKVSAVGVGTRAVAGRTVRATRTRAEGCKVSYRWQLGARTVGSGTRLALPRSSRGKRLTLVVTAGRGGDAPVRTLTWGRVAAQ